jgi:hypothetical protein
LAIAYTYTHLDEAFSDTPTIDAPAGCNHKKISAHVRAA